MTRERYFKMCEQLGQEPKEEEIPLDASDFPDIVIFALETFGSLGDRIYPEVGYVGKDFTNLPLYLKLYDIDNVDLFLEILVFLDSRAVKHSQEVLTREREKLKRKSSGTGHNNTYPKSKTGRQRV